MAEEKHDGSEMKEVDVLEFSLTSEEIDELISKLTKLKQLKTSISFDVDDENEFVIHYESGGDLGEVESQDDDNLKKEGYEKSEKAIGDPKKPSEIINQPGEIPSLEGVERQ